MEKGKIYTMPATVKTGMAVLTSDKVDFRAKNAIRKKESNFIITKLFTSREAITIPSIYSPNNKALKYMKRN